MSAVRERLCSFFEKFIQENMPLDWMSREAGMPFGYQYIVDSACCYAGLIV